MGCCFLHGPAIKAANTRAASGAFADLIQGYVNALVVADEYEQHLVQITRLLHDIITLMWTSPRFMSENALANLSGMCASFGEIYMRLRATCCARNVLAWEVTPKVHRMQHIPLYAGIMNPSFVQCYGEESLIGTTTKVWKKSLASRWERGVQRRVLLKRMCGLFLRLDGA